MSPLVKLVVCLYYELYGVKSQVVCDSSIVVWVVVNNEEKYMLISELTCFECSSIVGAGCTGSSVPSSRSLSSSSSCYGMDTPVSSCVCEYHDQFVTHSHSTRGWCAVLCCAASDRALFTVAAMIWNQSRVLCASNSNFVIDHRTV